MQQYIQSAVHVSQLLCLDEEITSSLESEELASQDITLSPGGIEVAFLEL